MRLQTVNRVGRAKRASPSEKWFAHRARPRPSAASVPSDRRFLQRCAAAWTAVTSCGARRCQRRRQPTECERGRGRMDLEEAFLREMTQTDASADATVSFDVRFDVSTLWIPILSKLCFDGTWKNEKYAKMNMNLSEQICLVQ